jgi:subtilisin family serine protease
MVSQLLSCRISAVHLPNFLSGAQSHRALAAWAVEIAINSNVIVTVAAAANIAPNATRRTICPPRAANNQ